jgi:hypothetical protein
MSDDTAKQAFWANFLRALGAQPRSATTIVGASGLQHPILALGADDRQKRLVLVSSDYDARAAAMLQADVQGVLPDVSVVVARPIAIGLPTIAKGLIEYFGATLVPTKRLQEFGTASEQEKKRFQDVMGAVCKPIDKSFKQASLDIYIHKSYSQLDKPPILICRP